MLYTPRKMRRAREHEFMTELVEVDVVSELFRAARFLESDEVATLAKDLSSALSGVSAGMRLPINIGLIVEDAIGVLLTAEVRGSLPHSGVVAADLASAFGRLGGKIQPAIVAKLRWDKKLSARELLAA